MIFCTPPKTINKTNGFSLMEILVVLLVMAVATALVTPSTLKMADRIQFRKQTNKVMATLRYARLMAVSKGKEVRVTLGEDEAHTLQLTGAVTDTKNFDLTDDGGLTLEPEEIVFFAESMATPATIILDRGEKRQIITMDPLTAQPLLQ